MGAEIVKTIEVNGTEVIVFGVWDDETPENEYEYYDFDIGGYCINEGNPHYGKEENLIETIKKHLKFYKENVL
jgi:hypothetical protein